MSLNNYKKLNYNIIIIVSVFLNTFYDVYYSIDAKFVWKFKFVRIYVCTKDI